VWIRAVCPAGYTVTGGSARLHNIPGSTPISGFAGPKELNIQVAGQYPLVFQTDLGGAPGRWVPAEQSQLPPTAWEVEVSTTASSTGSISVYAMCSK
jgi:hypothetical protein